MTGLETATAHAAAAAWAASGPKWTKDQIQTVAGWLVRLSAKVTAHVVDDVPIGDDDLQEFLIHRLTGRLNDWLVSAATTIRAGYGLSGVRHTPAAVRGIGLRSATVAEIEALPGVDEVSAMRLSRYLAEHPGTTDIDDLRNVRRVGATRLGQLKSAAYLERPRTGLISPTLWAFLNNPDVGTFINVLLRTDLFLWFGDQNSAERRIQAASDDPFERFVSFLALVDAQAEKTTSIADAVTTSEAVHWLHRHRLRGQLLAALAPAAGEILTDGDYLPSVKAALDGADTEIDLLMFLGTSAAGSPESPGPLQLIEAVTAAAARGVQVRVILDQDDGGEPYRSLFINKPLAKRLQASGVGVKFDDPQTLLHSKVLVIDDNTIVLGSHNWTANGLSMTHELSVLLTSPQLTQQAKMRFQQLWDALPDVPPLPQ